MQNAGLDESNKLESRLLGEMSIPQICRWYHPNGRKQRTKEPPDESEKGEWKSQRDGMGREEGGGFRMGNTCIPVADSFWYMAKLIQLCKV